ncbi:Uncharacterized membrane-anchored protein [Alkalibacterium putridalgicola]|uniref:Membrane protein n=1 Tax=Alkalibacterium putridalgicola TaxID=426703 RepID=A0A1H7X1B2_9LACT|nr:DUF1129 family protein [Alkalibacterium putridalgicola]GEK90185.1 membrane protein [Alkalibacterium putridalgicola]SEM27364.1 Uncharacterized membrane-anchored protein [Alkalibacterium putridalgicola]
MAKKNTSNEQESQIDYAAKEKENAALFDQLTNKNQEYMIKLNRRLDDANMSEERKTIIFNDMLKNIVAEQANHVTARSIYGTVTDQARYLIEGKRGVVQEPVERSESWKLWLDGALLLGGMFAVITGISYFTGNEEAGLGLLTLILNFILGGFAVMIITKYAPRPGVKGGFLKYVLATTLTMVVWIMLMAFGTALIPAALNPVIPGPYTLAIGLVAFLAKWYLKKKLDIKGTLI